MLILATQNIEANEKFCNSNAKKSCIEFTQKHEYIEYKEHWETIKKYIKSSILQANCN